MSWLRGLAREYPNTLLAALTPMFWWTVIAVLLVLAVKVEHAPSVPWGPSFALFGVFLVGGVVWGLGADRRERAERRRERLGERVPALWVVSRW